MPLFPDDVLFSQRLMSCAGFYRGKLDGEPGPKTVAAWDDWEAEYRRIRSAADVFDAQTELHLYTILPGAQTLVRKLMTRLLAAGLDIKVVQGSRTYREQDAIFAQGRTLPGSIVTNARGGQSKHNAGIAVDIGIFEAGRYLTDSPLYSIAGAVAASIPGLEWGGNWPTPDLPHHQVATSLLWRQLQVAFEAGRPFLPGVPG